MYIIKFKYINYLKIKTYKNIEKHIMPDYSTGKIYKIINPQNETIYIGSTTQKLSQRFCRHDHKDNGNKIILIENYPCNSREELVKKEQEVIEQYDNLLNQFRAFNSEEYNKEYYKKYHKEYCENNRDKLSEKHKKWYETNKDKIIEKSKVYHENNRDKILEKRKVKLICECGCEINKQHMLRHKKTKKHIKLMETK